MLRRANYEAWAIKLKRKAEELKREEGVCVQKGRNPLSANETVYTYVCCVFHCL